MMSKKLGTLCLLKVKVLWNKSYDIKISVYDATNKVLLRDSHYVVDVVMWPKFANSFGTGAKYGLEILHKRG